MSTKKPKLIPEAIKVEHAMDPKDAWLDSLYFRTQTLLAELETGKLNKETVVFETLLSAFSFLENGLAHSEIQSAYPCESWRKDTVEIPIALLRPLLEAWTKYKLAPDGSTFGEALGIEGGGQGKSPIKKHLAKLNRDSRLSNLVVVEYLDSQQSGKQHSWENAIAIVAERENVGVATVKRASEAIRTSTIERLKTRGVIN